MKHGNVPIDEDIVLVLSNRRIPFVVLIVGWRGTLDDDSVTVQ